MPYIIQPEQELIQLSEDELYAQLICLREQVSADLTQSTFPAPMLKLDNSTRGYFPSR
jgi:hypothetical protein